MSKNSRPQVLPIMFYPSPLEYHLISRCPLADSSLGVFSISGEVSECSPVPENILLFHFHSALLKLIDLLYRVFDALALFYFFALKCQTISLEFLRYSGFTT